MFVFVVAGAAIITLRVTTKSSNVSGLVRVRYKAQGDP